MESYLLIGAVIVIIYFAFDKTKSKKKAPEKKEEDFEFTTELPSKEDYSKKYQSKWLFSLNEKNEYRKLKEIADKHQYTVFAKVRLLDLLEPRPGDPKWKTYFYKVQAKHVDFVLCNEKLVAKYIIELDDASHDKADRQKRDEFVDEVLTSVGYKVVHVRNVGSEIEELFEKKETSPAV